MNRVFEIVKAMPTDTTRHHVKIIRQILVLIPTTRPANSVIR